jgi:hypothetical protein
MSKTEGGILILVARNLKTMIESFIPNELAVAPNPLGLAPNLKLTTIPVDANSRFELWMPLGDEILMPEEAMLLRGDCSRLEEICDRLVWLLGARLVTEQQEAYPSLAHDWRTVKQLIEQNGGKFSALSFSHIPQSISPCHTNSMGTSWTLYPTSWHILPLELKPYGKGYQVVSSPVQVLLTMGECVTRQEQKTKIAADRVLS